MGNVYDRNCNTMGTNEYFNNQIHRNKRTYTERRMISFKEIAMYIYKYTYCCYIKPEHRYVNLTQLKFVSITVVREFASVFSNKII